MTGFAPIPRKGRIAAIGSTSSADFLLVENPDDIRWATGFSGSVSTLVVDRASGRGTLLVDARYSERAIAETAGSDADVETTTREKGVDAAVAGLVGARSVAVDPDRTTIARSRRLAAAVTVLEGTTNLADLRRVKSDPEIARMAAAADSATRALLRVVSEGLVDRTEREIRARLDSLMVEFGADGSAFPTIVATGPHGARPHHEAGDARVERGHAVVVDLGAMVDGYRSDMTRTILAGTPPREIAAMHALVLEAQASGVRSVRAGVEGSAVDAAPRGVFRASGVEAEFVHGTGHGVGLAIHETPILGPSCTEVLREGEVVTVEPGLYRVGVGGVRIEDLVVVGASGARSLTLAPKDLECPRSRPTT